MWWLVVENGSADLCRDDPGHELTLIVESSVRALTDVWTGEREPAEVLRSERAARHRARPAMRNGYGTGWDAVHFAATRSQRARNGLVAQPSRWCCARIWPSVERKPANRSLLLGDDRRRERARQSSRCRVCLRLC